MNMRKATRTRTWKHSATELALRRAKASPGALISAQDLREVSAAAAAKALSRLAEKGILQRAGKGLYYLPVNTPLGKSRPNPVAVAQRLLTGKARPTGSTAANLLGLSTQVAARPELAVYGSARPKGVKGARLKLRTGSTPELDPKDAALLEFLRERGLFSERDATSTFAHLRAALFEAQQVRETIEEARKKRSSIDVAGDRLATLRLETAFLTQDDHQQVKVSRRLKRLIDAALDEPPRVRAILGALLQWSGMPEKVWQPLRASLNGLSKFDFGLFKELPNSKEWQAK